MTEVRLGLALGGGGARGFAHIGVLLALEQAGFRPAVIGGSSMGGLIAAGYALTGSATAVEEWSRRVHVSQSWFLLTTLFPQLLRRRLLRLYGNATFDQMHMPCVVSATDIVSRRSVALCEGPVVDAMLATTRIPFLFPPIQREEMILVDGGFTSLIPVRAVRALGATHVIGVYTGMVGRDRDHGRPTRISALVTVADMLGKLANREEMAEADLLLAPPVTDLWLTAFHRRNQAIELGFREVQARLPEIRRLATGAMAAS